MFWLKTKHKTFGFSEQMHNRANPSGKKSQNHAKGYVQRAQEAE